MKKPGFHVFFGVLSLLLLFHFSASALLILPNQDEKEVKTIDVAHARSSTELRYVVEVPESDECDDDEECSERRMIAEAHLDYIYTQHHKPAYKHKP
ncbi:putative phytosulfokines 6 [Prosopis cineraria]|uniref:putative phytosulfokines 6 n=1 Tax=Prosopis cineraria TaxID=364024 RepID=UPI002410332B|nr:putative phytosulfokines 6 [Prosopis cineraria]